MLEELVLLTSDLPFPRLFFLCFSKCKERENPDQQYVSLSHCCLRRVLSSFDHQFSTNKSYLTTLIFLCCRHVGCDCPDGYHGDHCEIASSAHSITEVVYQATSKKSVGALVAIIIGSVVGVVAVFFVKERFIDRPRRERARENAMTPGMRAQAELSTRRNRTRGIV